MPPFGDMLTDQQVAAVVNYVRSHFGNAFADEEVSEFVDRIRRFLRLPEDETIPFTAEPKPCSRFCVICTSRSPLVYGFKLKNWLLTCVYWLAYVTWAFNPNDQFCEYCAWYVRES